jgi:hypothetical protein
MFFSIVLSLFFKTDSATLHVPDWLVARAREALAPSSGSTSWAYSDLFTRLEVLELSRCGS